MSKNQAIQGTVDDLRHIALFARMSEAELARVAALGDPVDAEVGALLMDQGDVGRECFLVLEGEAGVFAAGQHVATIGPGTVVGEMALVGHRPRNATVTAQNAMRLLSFNISSFKKLLDEMPVAQKHIYDLLEARARETSGS
ncbi:MAG: cyclic nucleotide-binding domain-containing protein [Acidimicrobiales bacterium]